MSSAGVQIARSTIVNIAGRACAILFGVLAIAAVTRHLGAEGFGWYTTVTAFLQFFGIFADFGLMIVTSQMLGSLRGQARTEALPAPTRTGADNAPLPAGEGEGGPATESRIISTMLSFRLVSAAIFFLAAPLVSLLFPYPPVIKIGIAVTSASFFFIALQQIFVSIFQVRLKGARIAIGEAGGRLVLLLGILAAIAMGHGLYAILLAHVLANGLQLLYLALSAGKLIPIRLAWEGALIREIVAKSWPIGLSIIFNLVYLRADTLILSLTRTQVEVGLYGAPYRVIDVLNALPFLFMGFVLPAMSAAYVRHDFKKLSRLVASALNALFMLALPVVAGGAVLATPLMVFIAGSEFAASGPLLVILLFALLGVFLSAVFGHAIVAIGAQRTILWAFAANACFSLALYLILIPRFGATAAAIISVVSELFYLIAAWTLVVRRTRFHFAPATLGKCIIAGFVMVGALLSVRDSIPLLATIFIGAGVYGAMLVLLKVLTVNFLRTLLRPSV